MQAENQFKHPPALYILAFTASWERFSYYGMRAFLILYMVNASTHHLSGLSWSDGLAGRVYGIFTGLCYLTPLLGGYLADRWLGQRRSVTLGGLLIMVGHFTCAWDQGLLSFIPGLTLLVLGNGFFKPTVITMIGDLYEQGDKRRDSAFTLYYMLFNGGVFLAPLLCGYLGETYGYRYGFLTAGFGMMLGLIIYLVTAPRYLGNLGMVSKHVEYRNASQQKVPLTKDETDRIAVIVVLMVFTIFFWAGYEQAGSSFNLYTDRYIDRVVGGWEIPTSWFQSINPLFVVLLSPFFSWLWLALEKRKKNPSTPSKMAWGMLFLGIGFIFMLGAVMQRGGNIKDPSIKAGLFWLLATYFFHTIGEICLSPIGLSMVTKLAPFRMVSLFMGVWFLSSFIANVLGGFLVEYIEQLGPQLVFSGIAVFMVLLGLVVFLLARWLLTMMHGRD